MITTLHRDRPDRDSLATALAQLHNHGHSPSWSALYPHARTVALPTYAFNTATTGWPPPRPPTSAGSAWSRSEHPLLGAVDRTGRPRPGHGQRAAVTGTQRWLAGHQVNDTVLFPATGFIEVILRAGELAGCPVIDELVLHTALILVGAGADRSADLWCNRSTSGGGARLACTPRTGGQHTPRPGRCTPAAR